MNEMCFEKNIVAAGIFSGYSYAMTINTAKLCVHKQDW